MTSGAIRRAKLQSNHHHQQTNTQVVSDDGLTRLIDTVIQAHLLAIMYSRNCLHAMHTAD